MSNDALKDKILRLATLQEVAGRYISLQRKGAGYIGLCPFHTDKHPSLHVHPGKQFFKCFACGEGGDVFAFVQKIEHCSFPEALRILSAWYGIWLPADEKERTTPPEKRKTNREVPQEPLPDQQWIASIRREHQAFRAMLQPYMPPCDVLRDTYRLFGVGVAPVEVPFAYQPLRQRLIFPICNDEGELVAFAGRRLTGDAAAGPKYINSATSPLYQKGSLLYGLHQAGEAIRERRFVFVTEGYKDALAMHAAGFGNTVALCGVAFTDSHAALLLRYTHRIVLLLDADGTGEGAMARFLQSFAANPSMSGFSLSRMQLPVGEDPDSLLCKLSPDAFRQLITSSLRLARLETYEQLLLSQVRTTMADLSRCLTYEERISLLSLLAKQKSRLSRVTVRLGRNVVVMW